MDWSEKIENRCLYGSQFLELTEKGSLSDGFQLKT